MHSRITRTIVLVSAVQANLTGIACHNAYSIKPLTPSVQRELVTLVVTVFKTITTTRSCRSQKRAVHFYSPGVVRRSHAAARHVRYCCMLRRCCSSATVAAATPDKTHCIRQFAD